MTIALFNKRTKRKTKHNRMRLAHGRATSIGKVNHRSQSKGILNLNKRDMLSFERKRIMLEETEVTRGLVRHYVETYAYADARLEVRWKEYSLPYKGVSTRTSV